MSIFRDRITARITTGRATRTAALFTAALVGLGGVVTASAQDSIGKDNALPATDLPDNQPLPSDQVLSAGDGPVGPVSFQTFSAGTVSPGVARVSIDSNCNAFTRDFCSDDIAEGAKISWFNVSNGRSGQSEILAADSAPGSYVDLKTGSGLVTAVITSPSDKEQYGLHTLVNGGGAFRVG
jgi:hypothetical protein